MNWQHHGTIRVYGIPKAQPRPRAFSRGGQASVYTPDSAKAWKKTIVAGAIAQLPNGALKGPVRVDTVFFFPRPKRLMRLIDAAGCLPHIAKPDIENCHKVVLDALTAAEIYRDDAQVCEGKMLKVYHGKGHQPGAVIMVYKELEL